MKSFYLKFGTGNPASYSGLSPTFTIFSLNGLTASVAPGITETPSSSGLYQFSYGPTMSVVFVADGGAALASSDRYIVGNLDPVQSVDEKIGTSVDSYGSTLVDPSTMFGYLKRGQEFNEGNKLFTKSTGVWQIFTRGSSALIAQKTLTNTTTTSGST